MKKSFTREPGQLKLTVSALVLEYGSGCSSDLAKILGVNTSLLLLHKSHRSKRPYVLCSIQLVVYLPTVLVAGV
jgi:hypothetical protein